MGKISTYSVLSTPTVNDKLIGTDVTTNNETKNFLVSDLLALGEGNVGKFLGGGIVVAEWNENGVKKALVASLTDLSAGLFWATSSYDNTLIGPTAQSYSNGSTNTDAIIAQTGVPADNTYAAGIARLHNGGSYSDWYLPAVWELNMCYNSAAIVNRILGSTNGFLTTNYYWSSTEFNNVAAWQQDFGLGTLSTGSKNSSNSVRAVRIHNI
jgi:hypothetical protein